MDPKLLMPFRYGWKREVVNRNENTGVDVYYHTPDYKKLRSTREVLNYLNLKQRTRLKINNFTFKRKPLGLPKSKEICRTARTSKKVEKKQDRAPIDKNKNRRPPRLPNTKEICRPASTSKKVEKKQQRAPNDKKKKQKQTKQLDIKEENQTKVQSVRNFVYYPLLQVLQKTPELDDICSFETFMFHECKGRRFQFKKGSDIDNQATIAFINDLRTNYGVKYGGRT
ncbi:Methyl-CpG DNA binding,DNA-binding domain [Cinara cedri]|uniref:Methyl-CpG DNA binding,DNA-binding domain n=1 Tax=Cinara cedri TaxID=506608 RepID=A0A5E4N5H1_9HEMI|nr:Methyl-CpG DNA binding,DNA-binding domain [Cinara cedri]